MKQKYRSIVYIYVYEKNIYIYLYIVFFTLRKKISPKHLKYLYSPVVLCKTIRRNAAELT